jgi:hypothetical protein
MADHHDETGGLAAGAGLSAYWRRSRQPLQILTFLLPLILVYEVGLAWVLRSDRGVITNKAHETLLQFFQIMGVNEVGGLYLGGVVIVVVLVIWHLLVRDPWHLDLEATALMAVESLLLTLPLLALGLLVQRGVIMSGQAPVDLTTLNLGSKLAISIGAGLYEELLFRMLLIAGVHTLLVDLAHVRHGVGVTVAVVISAVAFTWYHPLRDATGVLSPTRATFYFLAGIYFGLVYVGRGFGIVVATHALYDIITVAMWR